MKRPVKCPRLLLIASLLLVAAGCGDQDPASQGERPALVLTRPVQSAEIGGARLSGTVRARYETPVSFQVAGRILAREVDAGDRVEIGQALFRLEPDDFVQQVAVARADLQAARAELETAEADTRRNRDLLEREFISDQVFERVQLAEKSARERVDAARARVEQAQNRLGYTELVARRDGTLIEVTGEPGQVVSAGQPVGVIARHGEPEIEVFLPERLGVPETGRIVAGGNPGAGLVLREAAGAADAVTRTWKARYSVTGDSASLRLGAVVKVELDTGAIDGGIFEVPVGAINERGHGPQVWVIANGRAEPVRVDVLDMDTENARIVVDPEAGLEPGTPVIALGTHLLRPGMAVRALQ